MQNKPNRFPIRKPGRWLAIAFGGLLLFRFCVYPFTPYPDGLNTACLIG